MATLTTFGRTIRKLRVDKGMKLLELANALGHSSSYCSAIETGRKPIPDGYVAHVIRAMDLSPTQSRELRGAADRTRKDVRVQGLSEDQRELVAAFARRIDELDEDMLVTLRRAVLKSTAGETPFRRKRRGILVPPKSAAYLREFAEKVRAAFIKDHQVQFPIIEVLEFGISHIFPDFCFDVRTQEEMGEDEGRVVAGSFTLLLREDVYVGACNGNGRDRFTASHELGHFFMHRQITMARAHEDGHKIYCDSEWQADVFAGSLLMSARHHPQFTDPDDAARQCGMTPLAAKVMLSKYGEGR
jgi:transcriptional regulator with XRE-family HTH domain